MGDTEKTFIDDNKSALLDEMGQKISIINEVISQTIRLTPTEKIICRFIYIKKFFNRNF